MTNPKHTDTSRSGDLVERLRWGAWYYEDPFDGKAYASDDPLEAADSIEELDRHLTLSGKVGKALSERIEALEAEVERLREALAEIESVGYDDFDPLGMAHEIARAALGEKQ